MNKKTLIIAGGSILGVLIILIIVVWLMTMFKTTYYGYETVEDKIVAATSNYYKENPEELPVSEGKFSLPYSILVDGGYIKPLDKLLKDGKDCSAEIYVINSNGKYSYIPKLTCGENYASIELYKQILAKTEVVETGSGLYRDYDGTYYFRGKATNNYVAFGTTTEKKKTIDLIWRIISISPDGVIKIISMSPTSSKTEFDSRYNVQKKSNIGYNDFELSIMHDYLRTLNDSTFLKKSEKAKIKPMNICVGTRTNADTTKDGSSECSVLSSDQLLFGTLAPYEYLRASLDEDCVNTTSMACSNYNFLAYFAEKESWTTIANPINNYDVYSFTGRTFALSHAKSKKVLYLTTNLNEYAFYKSGTGTSTDPYRLFSTTKKSTTSN